jgi:hypothetical protein
LRSNAIVPPLPVFGFAEKLNLVSRLDLGSNLSDRYGLPRRLQDREYRCAQLSMGRCSVGYARPYGGDLSGVDTTLDPPDLTIQF